MRGMLIAALLTAGCTLHMGTPGDVDNDFDDALCTPSDEVCDGLDNDCDGVVDDYRLDCCSWSTEDAYVGACVDGRVIGCGWCLEPGGQPGMGPESW